VAEIADQRLAAFARDALPRLRERFPALHAIAFGSRARGDAITTSDLDVILVSPAFADIPFLKRPVVVLEALGYPGALDLLCYTPEEFEERRHELGIVRVAVEEGVTL
jgi:predicted nucleotidyltransferase